VTVHPNGVFENGKGKQVSSDCSFVSLVGQDELSSVHVIFVLSYFCLVICIGMERLCFSCFVDRVIMSVRLCSCICGAQLEMCRSIECR
jgi:hypothetical protein